MSVRARSPASSSATTSSASALVWWTNGQRPLSARSFGSPISLRRMLNIDPLVAAEAAVQRSGWLQEELSDGATCVDAVHRVADQRRNG